MSLGLQGPAYGRCLSSQVFADPQVRALYGKARAALEVDEARQALTGISLTVVGQVEPLTLDRLVDAVRTGADIVYLVCHGALTRQLEPILYLADQAGRTAPVKGSVFAQRLAELPESPRLMVLASCESAGRADASPTLDRAAAHGSLAPLLAEVGVPAVLAMQAEISMETVRLVMPRFFRELLVDGQIDRALAAARGVVRARPEHWVPALFLRLKTTRLWYQPGLKGTENPLSQWRALCQCVHQGKFLPILGPDLDEGLFGGVHALATRIASAHAYPNAEHERADMAKVAQFLSVEHDRGFAHNAVQTGRWS